MKRVIPPFVDPACPDCGSPGHYGSARCPYLEHTAPCVVCATETVYACSDCAIELKGRAVHVCTSPDCRDRHEADAHGNATTDEGALK